MNEFNMFNENMLWLPYQNAGTGTQVFLKVQDPFQYRGYHFRNLLACSHGHSDRFSPLWSKFMTGWIFMESRPAKHRVSRVKLSVKTSRRRLNSTTLLYWNLNIMFSRLFSHLRFVISLTISIVVSRISYCRRLYKRLHSERQRL